MFTLPHEVISVLAMFRPLFSLSVWLSAETLVLGALLSQGSRTVTSCLRSVGLQDESHFCNYHRVLSRAKWSSLTAAKILFGAIVLFMIPPCSPLIIGADETLERRRGKKIKAKGWYRDAVQSHGNHVVTCLGLEWLSLQLIVPVPWSSRLWALPFLTILQPSKKANEEAGKRHKTSIDWTIQALKQIRRWSPTRDLIFLVDGAFASFELLEISVSLQISLVSRLRISARLYDFPPATSQGKRGPKPKKGDKLPKFQEVAQDSSLAWKTDSMEWYQRGEKKFRYFTSTALWHKTNHDPLPIRWVLVWLDGAKNPQVFFSNRLEWDAITILQYYMKRWNVEVTFEEARAQLGVETQRQWSDLAILRTTPALMGLFSIITIAATFKFQQEPFVPSQTRWYQKEQITFSDIMAWIRRDTWSRKYFHSSNSHKPKLFQQHEVQTLINQLLNAA